MTKEQIIDIMKEEITDRYIDGRTGKPIPLSDPYFILGKDIYDVLGMTEIVIDDVKYRLVRAK